MSFDNIRLHLDSINYLYAENIHYLTERFAEIDSEEKRHEFYEFLLRYFTLHPRKTKYIEQKYFQNMFSENDFYWASRLGSHFGRGQFEVARQCAVNISNWNSVNCNLLPARIAYAENDLTREQSALEAAEKQYGLIPDIALSWLEFYYKQENIEKANYYLDLAREPLEDFLSDEIEAVREPARYLRASIEGKPLNTPDEFDIYDDELTRLTWLGYYERFIMQSRFQSGDGFLIDSVDQSMTDLIQSENIQHVLDFGSLCAEIIARPARKCPKTNFVGIDRQEFVATMNYQGYDEPNMSFVSGDIFDYLPEFAKLDGKKLLFHARTACLIYPDIVTNIYKKCHSAGVEYIMFWEGDGLSRDTMKLEGFETMKEVSVARKSVLLNHNYKQILSDAGYEVVEFARMDSPALIKTFSDLVGSALFVIARRKD